MDGRRSRSERVYRALLRLYPAAFRERFGDEMVQLLGDQLRDARAAGGVGTTVRTWLRTIGDLVITAASEHFQKDRTVAHSLTLPPSTASRALGIAGVIGGLVLVAGYIPNLNWGGLFVLRLTLFNASTIAIVIAVHRRQAARWRLGSFATAALAILGNASYLVMDVLAIGRPQFPEPDPAFRQIFFAAAIVMWVGDALFALLAVRLGAVSRWASLMVAVGTIVALLAMGNLGETFPWLMGLIELTAPVHLWGVAVAGVGWILLSIDVATRRRPREAAPVPATTTDA